MILNVYTFIMFYHILSIHVFVVLVLSMIEKQTKRREAEHAWSTYAEDQPHNDGHVKWSKMAQTDEKKL